MTQNASFYFEEETEDEELFNTLEDEYDYFTDEEEEENRNSGKFIFKINSRGVLTCVGNYVKEKSVCVIPEGVRKIGENAFTDSENITEIVLPSSLVCIADEAFSLCTEIEKIIIPEGVRKIGAMAFAGCANLKTVVIASSYLERIEGGCFSNCEKLVNINIPSSVLYLEDSAFHRCSSLVMITLPHDIREIGTGCFTGCSSLIAIMGGRENVVTNTGYISGCEKLSILFGKEFKDDVLIYKNILFSVVRGKGTYKFPKGLKGLGTNSFSFCNNIKKISVPSLNLLCDGVFENNTGLTEVVIEEGVKELPPRFFRNCYKLKKVTLPSSLEVIGSEAFFGCIELKEIKFNANLKRIGEAAFKYCEKLCNFTFPQNLEEIGSRAFSHCNSLSEIKIPSKIKTIKRGTFEICPNLKTIIIPDTLDSVMDCSFGKFRGDEVELIKVYETGNITENHILEIGGFGNWFPECVKKICLPKGYKNLGLYYNSDEFDDTIIEEY